MGFRSSQRVEGVHHTTVIHWSKQVGGQLHDRYNPDVRPEVRELNELERECLIALMNCFPGKLYQLKMSITR